MNNIERLEELAKQGIIDAQQSLGQSYLSGKVVEKDEVKAAHYFMMAAEQGDGYSQYLLGLCYFRKTSKIHDYEKAAIWLEKALDNKLFVSHTLLYLGDCYYYGETIKDLVKAFELYIKSAERGNIEAMERVALCYKKGDGIKQDNNIAEEWYKKAEKKRKKYELERKLQESRDRQEDWKRELAEMSDTSDAIDGYPDAVWNID